MAAAAAIDGDDVAWIERQLTEVESLRQIYFEEDEVRVDVAALEALSALAQDGFQASTSSSSSAAAPVSVSVRLRGGDDGAEASHVRLSAVLPWGYPSSRSGEASSSPVVWLEPGDGAGPLEGAIVGDDDLCAELQARALELASLGEECLLPLIQAAEELVGQRFSALAGAAASIAEAEAEDDEALAQAIFDEEMAAAQANATARARQGGPPRLGRRAMFSHHIIASSKRQAISQWAAQLQLGGVAKIGWPGLIIVEGDEEDVKAYVDALSRLRWKHFVVRGEQIVEGQPGQRVDDLRALPARFEEFGTDAMSEFAACCRAHGLEELFLIALKLPPGAGAGDGAEKRKGGKKR